MVSSIKLPKKDGELYTYTPKKAVSFELPKQQFRQRIAISAAHVVADPLSDTDPIHHSHIDMEATMEYRHYLWSLGFGVAEAMDTAQRGMGLNWEQAKALMSRSIHESKSVNGMLFNGAGTDHLAPHPDVLLEDVESAYEEQCEFIESQGGRIIIMASRALAVSAQSPDDYEKVYGNLLNKVSQPVILHWLGDMFDPALKGYWGYDDIDQAMQVCLRIIREHEEKIDGIKISLLDDQQEIKMRRLLPDSVNMYTGDDFNYPDLIKGDSHGYSHALLGIFDAIAPAAAAAMHALDENDVARYDALLEKTVPLARHIFQTPTYAYKTGVVFMAYLNGHQSHFRMIGGAEGQRSIIHLAELFVMANEAGLLQNPEIATEKMITILKQAGIEQN